MARTRLYVRSKRTTIVTGHVSVETIGTNHTTSEYAEGSTYASLSPQDASARDLLRKSAVKFDLVDISKGIGPRLSARLKGVKQTPTLLDGNNPQKLYAGVKEISQYIENKTRRES